jgi:hypothetical protein
MSNPKYCCLIPGCTESRTNKNYLNHLFSHSLESFPKSLVDSLARSSSGSLWVITPKVGEDTRRNEVCLGCKKFFYKFALSSAHKQCCPNKESHKSFIKGFLTQKKDGADSDISSNVSESVDQSEKTAGSLGQITKLENKIKSLERNAKSDKKLLDEADEQENAFIHIMDMVSNSNIKMYDELLDSLKSMYPTIYEKYSMT